MPAACPVVPHDAGAACERVLAARPRQLVERDDQRRPRDDARGPVDVRVSLERPSMLSRVRAWRPACRPACACRRRARRASRGPSVSTSTRAYQTSMSRIVAKRAIALAVLARAAASTIALAVARREAALARGDHDAGRQPLDVPLPGAGERLVEVVDVEDEAPLGRAEDAEVREVGVTAALHVEARARRRREVGGHDRRGAAIERERRGEHAAVADRHELGHARRGLRLEDADRVGPLRRRLVRAVARARDSGARRPPALGARSAGSVWSSCERPS